MAAGIVKRCVGILQYQSEPVLDDDYYARYAYHRVGELLELLLSWSRQSIDEWRNALWTAFLDADFLSVDIAIWCTELEAILESFQQSDDPLLGRILEYLLSDGNLENLFEKSILGSGQRILFILARLKAQSSFIIPEEHWNCCFDTFSRYDFSSSTDDDSEIDWFKGNLEKFKTFIRNGRNGPIPGEPQESSLESTSQQASDSHSISFSQPPVSRGWHAVWNVVRGFSLLGLKRRVQAGDVEMGDLTDVDAPAEGMIAMAGIGEDRNSEQNHSLEVDGGICNQREEDEN
ncbi:hypothetical protein K435DRAFT_796381 [Dendrothele bispora CBS 962.96]|uniref:Uncharacterized protein n=1 Tax=Dendrothele bispora (strain CBS 962.96) TaxID=1314807 RepID=A0A4V4HG65_DENBC|nr:hypothetical protein K435DRAFT_796381 [Dendrothele bispora CBS 962.96]